MSEYTIGVLASGRGTDFQSLVDAKERGDLEVEIGLLICNNEDAPVLQRAAKHGIPTAYIDHRGRTREDFEGEIVTALKQAGVDLVVFAGFMRIVTSTLIGAFRNRIVNIHPSLLPAFPGVHAQKDALEWGTRVTGCTIHLVDESVDGGPVIFQKAVPVMPGDDPETLSARILEVEHQILPWVVGLFAQGRIRIEGRRVNILDEDQESVRPV